MSPTAVMERDAGMSPKARARLAGALYLVTMVLGSFAQSTAVRRLNLGDAAATARDILAQESLFRLVFAVYLVEMACQLTTIVLFYDLLKPVTRTGALLAAVFGLAGCIVKTVGRLFFFAPLLLLRDAHFASVFGTESVQGLALLFLRMNYTAENVAMVFFGGHAILLGYLVFRSDFLPRILGVLSAVGGLGWLTYLYEPLASRVLPFILGAALLGAIPKVLWLLVRGVNEQRWRAQAARAPS